MPSAFVGRDGAKTGTGVCEKNSHPSEDGGTLLQCPRTPNFNVDVRRQASIYKNGCFFADGSTRESQRVNIELWGGGGA